MDRHTLHLPETMNTTEITYDFESTLACVGKAVLAASETAARAGFDAEQCRQIGSAVREAVVNAVVHGNGNNAAKRVCISLESTSAGLTIAVGDEGPGFDPAGLPDPVAPENLLKKSGRGIFLIRAFMDEVEFAVHSGGSDLIMTKFVRGCGRDTNHPSKEPTQ